MLRGVLLVLNGPRRLERALEPPSPRVDAFEASRCSFCLGVLEGVELEASKRSFCMGVLETVALLRAVLGGEARNSSRASSRWLSRASAPSSRERKSSPALATGVRASGLARGAFPVDFAAGGGSSLKKGASLLGTFGAEIGEAEEVAIWWELEHQQC